MNNFMFDMPTKLFFGQNTIHNLSLIKQYGKKVLFHYGSGSIKNNGIYEQVINTLKQNNIEYIELGGVEANPNLNLSRKGVEICKNENIDFILAVGGGSVIDSAKAISVGAVSDKDIWDFYTGDCTDDITPLHLGTILTLPAAGSETSPVSILVNKETKDKLAYRNPLIRPVISIVDPTFTYSLPKYQIACGVSDILAHLMERYFTPTENTEFTDRLLESAMKTIVQNGKATVDNPTNYRYRSIVVHIGTLAHNDALSMGTIGDWACHGIERNLSGFYDNAHGEGLSVIYPAWFQVARASNEDRFLQFFKNVFGIDYNVSNKEYAFQNGVLALKTFYHSLGLSTTLTDAKKINFKPEHVDYFVKRCTGIGEFHKLSADDIKIIFDLAL